MKRYALIIAALLWAATSMPEAGAAQPLNPGAYINVIAYTQNQANGDTPSGSSVPINLLPYLNIINNTPWDLTLLAGAGCKDSNLFADIASSSTPVLVNQVIPGKNYNPNLGQTPLFHSLKIQLNDPNNTWINSMNVDDANTSSRSITLSISRPSAAASTLTFNIGSSQQWFYTHYNGDKEEVKGTTPETLLMMSPPVGFNSAVNYGMQSGAYIGNTTQIGTDEPIVNNSTLQVLGLTSYGGSPDSSAWVVASNFTPLGSVLVSNIRMPIPSYVNAGAMVYPNFSASGMDLCAIIMAPDGGEATLLLQAVPSQYDGLLGTPDPRG